MAKAKKNIYLVLKNDGTVLRFKTWAECERVVKGTPLKFAGGQTEAEAMAKLRKPSQRPSKAKSFQRTKKTGAENIPKEGICSDAGTHGNPGQSEYQVTDLQGNLLVHRHLGIHSNNYAELAGIGAMIRYAIESGEPLTLWTDSRIALGWVATLRIGQGVHERTMILKMAKKIQAMLSSNPQLKLKKWKTREWGQIPADFGRK